MSILSVAAVTLLATAASSASSPSTDAAAVTKAVHSALSRGAAEWLRTASAALKRAVPSQGDIVVLELDLDAKGSVRSLSLAVPGTDNAVDDLARGLVLHIEPFSPEPISNKSPSATEEAETLRRCVVRLGFAVANKKLAAESTVACLNDANQPLPSEIVGLQAASTANDAGAELFRGWDLESKGLPDEAARAYQSAARTAPQWDRAARAWGLTLLRKKKPLEALSHLKRYVQANAEPADATQLRAQIKRFEDMLAKRLDDAKRPRARLSKTDILRSIRKGYPLLEPCLKVARQEQKLAVGHDTLQLSWTVQKDGTIKSARLESPTTLTMTSHAECIEAAAQRWRFPPYTEGSEITVQRVPIKVRGSPTPSAVAATNVQQASASDALGQPESEALADEPTFSMCERTGADIGDYIQAHSAALSDCVEAERRRTKPGVSLPQLVSISFIVDADGPVRDVYIGHRHFRNGPLQSCLNEALGGKMPPSGGADCPAEFNIDMSGSSKP